MIVQVSLDRIRPNPWQTRIGDPDPDYIKSLALDIAQNGLLQAPVGRMHNGDWEIPFDQFEPSIWDMKLHEGNKLVVQLAFGHNRLAAFKWLYELRDNSNIPGDWSTMPVDIRTLDDKQMAVMAWSENEKRRDVSPIERAKGIEKRMSDFGWSQHEVADQLGVARPTISNMLRLLKLPQNIQDALHAGTISARVGSALLPMYELPESTMRLAEAGWGRRPSKIEKDALAGSSSDLTRSYVEELYDQWTKKLQGAEFGLDELFPEGVIAGYDYDASGTLTVYCGLCRTCDRRLKDQGNVCLDPNCYMAKQTLHRRAYLAKAAAKSGIQAIDPNKGGAVTDLPYTEETAAKIIAGKCENLRLVYDPNNREDHRNLIGHPHARIVCDKRNGSCTCIKGLDIQARQGGRGVAQVIQAEKEMDPEYEGEEEEEEDWDFDLKASQELGVNVAEVRAQTVDPKQLEEAARQARKDKMDVTKKIFEAREKVLKVLEEAFWDHQPGALYLVAANYPYPNRGDLDLQKIHKRLAGNVVHMIIPSDPNNVDELYEIINKKLEMLNLDAVYPYETLVETFSKEEESEH